MRSGARWMLLLGGALGQLAVWLVLRPDLAGPQWSEGATIEAWLAAEAVAAVLIGAVSPDRALIVRTVGAGWLLQALHFVVLGNHYDDTLWGIGVMLQVVFGGLAVGLALLIRALSARVRGSRSGG